MAPHQRIRSLFNKHMAGTATPEETRQLAEWVEAADHDTVSDLLGQSWDEFSDKTPVIHRQEANDILQQILRSEKDDQQTYPSAQTYPFEEKRRLMRPWQYAAAAAVLLMLTAGYWLYTGSRTKSNQPQPVVQRTNDASPGNRQAMLTLADGRKVLLDSAANGILAMQNSTQVEYRNGEVVYSTQPTTAGNKVAWNTLTTANGESYSLTLADGSKIWLNAASSARFPVSFTGKERRVEVSGEVYIEVAKNKAMPFIVSVNGMEVRALGTAFNINAYADEPTMRTTLVEGSVQVSGSNPESSAGKVLVLAPGQQSVCTPDGSMQQMKEVNTEEIIAWKEGTFYFDNADLQTILRQFARWYNVTIAYEGPIKNRKFFGIISRHSNLSAVLKMLQANDISFRIDGKKLVVTSM